MSVLAEPILILSDVHFAHPACLLEHWEELAPLLKQARTVVFNGDTVEMRYRTSMESARAVATELSAYCLGIGVTPVFVTGNHDPVVSTINHLELAGGQLLVIHGDVLFDEITPWSREASVACPAHLRIMEDMGGKHTLDLEGRLEAVRRACLEFEKFEARHPPNIFGKITTYLQELWPPTRPFKIIKIWMDTPGIAAKFAAKLRPQAKMVALGHTHRSGVWQVEGRAIVNTGSFTPLSGRLGVWVEGDTIRVRRILHRGGEWRFSRDIFTQKITPVRSEAPLPFVEDASPAALPTS